MYYIHHIDFFSIHTDVCAQKFLKHTSPGFDSVTPLHADKRLSICSDGFWIREISSKRFDSRM